MVEMGEGEYGESVGVLRGSEKRWVVGGAEIP